MQAAAATFPFLADKTGFAKLVFYGCALIGAQRILLQPLDAYTCVVMAGLALFYFQHDRRMANTALLLSVFLCVDNGAMVYAETPGPIRYVLYLACLGLMLYDFRTDAKRLALAFGLLLIPLLITASSMTYADSATLRGNVILALLTIVVLARSKESLTSAEIDWEVMAKFLLVFAISEIFTVRFFYSLQATGYLSYNGTKSVMAFLGFYYLCSRRFPVSLLVFAMGFYVILMYQTRMIVLSLVVVMALFLLGRIARLRPAELALTAILVVGGYFLFTSGIQLNFLKIVYSVQEAMNEFSLEQAMQAVDPVRYYELRMFFERDWLQILFGNGFGSGLFDANRYFSFIPWNNTAFSVEELRAARIYQFHDVWTDIGLRFGLVFIAALLLPLLIGMHSSSRAAAAVAMTLIVLIFSAFFSTSGLICIAMMALAYRAERGRVGAEKAAGP